MAMLNVRVIISIVVASNCFLVVSSCDVATISTEFAEELEPDVPPLFMSPIPIDGTAKSLDTQDKASLAARSYGDGISRSEPVAIFLDQLHADFRDKQETFDWCVGHKVTLELFDGQTIVAENSSIRAYDDSWSWTGTIVEGGVGRVWVFVSDSTNSIRGEIRLTSENRKLYIEPTADKELHILFERYGIRDQSISSDMARKSGDTLTDLETTRSRLEEQLQQPGRSEEFREGVQHVLDGINLRIEEEKAKQKQELSEDEASAAPIKNQTSQLSPASLPVVKVLVLAGTCVSNPQSHFDSIVGELIELFYENSDVDVVFTLATSAPISISIPGELSISSQNILSGVENGLYGTVPGGTPTTTLRNTHVADLNRPGFPGDQTV